MNIPNVKNLEGAGPCWDHHLGTGLPLFRCSNGHIGTIATHTVADNGEVSPSIVCPHAYCTFHETIRLMDWFKITPYGY